MKKQRLIQFSLGIVVVSLIAFFYLTKPKYNRYDWSENLRASSKTPYGTYLIHQLLQSKSNRDGSGFFEIDVPVRYALLDSTLRNSSYIFLGEEWFYAEKDIETILDFVMRGNNAYIISNYEPSELLEMINGYPVTFYSTVSDSVVEMSMKRSGLTDSSRFKFTYIEDWEPKYYEWNYADEYEDDRISTLGYFNDYYNNFFEIKLGQGSLYIHLSPILFTNFYLREEDKLRYAEMVFSDLNKTVYWDEFSQTPLDGVEESKSPLVFILSQPGLRWAWYLLLIMGLLYLAIYTRRRQNIVPVLPQKVNSSIEFVETMGSLYFQQSSYLKIVNHEKELFLSYLRTKYGISTNKADDDFIKKAALKSGVSGNEISFIIKEAKRLNFISNISEKDLIEYHKHIETFYQNCK